MSPNWLVGTLLAPVLAAQRVVGDVETIASGVLALQRDAHEQLASIDKRAGALVRAVGALRAPLDRMDRKLSELQKIEQAVTVRIDALHDDLNARMLAVEHEVHSMRPPIDEIARDLGTAVKLLPEPGDGPLARLKDTFTSS